MNSKIWKSGAVALASVLLVSGCNSPLEQRSNLSVDSKTASDKMKQRLDETVKVRELTRSIEKALKPIDGALSDVIALLKGEKTRLQGELPKFAVSELRYAMESLNNQMAVQQEDGSWVMEKEVKWPFERVSFSGESCSKMTVGLSALTSKDGKEVSAEVYLMECASKAKKKVVATIEGSSKGQMKVKFNSSSLESLGDASINIDNSCLIDIASAEHDYSISCVPFETTVAGIRVVFGDPSTGTGLSYTKTRYYDQMTMNVAGYKGEKFLGAYSVQQDGKDKWSVRPVKK